MRAIETMYAGTLFRSRLEARWAVFFDEVSVRWDYEPEGFELLPAASPWDRENNGHLGYYLPDFWLPDLNTWFEVKGRHPDDAEQARLGRFDELCQESEAGRLVTAIGSMPDPRTLNSMGHPYPSTTQDFDIELGGGCDFHYAWCICPWCGQAGVEFDARSARVCGWRTHDITESEAYEAIANNPNYWRIDDKCYNGDHPRIAAAYSAARSARFEHSHREVWKTATRPQ